MLRGLVQNAQDDKTLPMDARRGVEKIAGPKAFDPLYGLLPVQQGDKSRVWGVNSLAALPMFGGVFREDAAQQRGFWTPVSSSQKKGTRSGLWLAVLDPDATVAVPGAVSRVKEEAAGLEASSLRANAALSGKLFAMWSGNCASKSNETKCW